ncbi:MAG: DUF1552 domain-containing protein, partial [Verrucomicrobiales bacterium]|nr:DUF1552 domain-containing protein [Verrucomicrobiales bacterium]
KARGAGAVAGPPRRWVAMCAPLGFHAPFLHPAEVGTEYRPTLYLEPLARLRPKFTVFSGLAHAEQVGANGHASEMTWLTGAKRPGLAGFKNTISFDQYLAERIGGETRFPSLVLTLATDDTLSWTASGVPIPAEISPSRVFRQMFVEGTPAEVQEQMRASRRGRSILDALGEQAKKLHGELGRGDQEKLEEYLGAVRDLEGRLVQNEAWAKRPKPSVREAPPTDIRNRADAIGRMKLMQDLIVLALRTDSTRIVTLRLSGMNAVPEVPGVSQDWHNLSHHGQDPAKIEELKLIELAEFRAFAEFLGKLEAAEEGGVSLLDRTAVLFGSNLGNASAHDSRNLPLVLAGGGLRHGRHLAVDPSKHVFSDLFVSLGRWMGVPVERFGPSAGVLEV